MNKSPSKKQISLLIAGFILCLILGAILGLMFAYAAFGPWHEMHPTIMTEDNREDYPYFNPDAQTVSASEEPESFVPVAPSP